MEHRFHQINDQPAWVFKARLPHCQIWEHMITHAIAQAYPVDNYEKTHARINRNKPHLVHTLGAVVDHRSQKTFLLIERIPNRLSEVATLNESQTLKVLYAVFKGLEQLEDIYGHVGLAQSCICFNEMGKVKIWVNPDLSSLHPVSFAKQNGQNKVVQILFQIVYMIQSKSFNTSFLKIFDKKLKDNKILTYRQACQQISKIGELLFIDIQQKSSNAYQHFVSRQNVNSKTLKNQHIPERDCNNTKKYLKTQYENPKTYRGERPSGVSGHARKLSNHQTTHQSAHRRYQSFMEPDQVNKKQPQASKPNNFNLNLNCFNESKFSQSQVHKSAPLSPRDQVNMGYQTPLCQNQNFNKKHINQMQEYCAQPKQIIPKLKISSKKQIGLHRNQKPLKTTFAPIKEDVDDSFSHNLKLDDKQIMMSGEFQTFGILQDLNDKSFDSKGERKTGQQLNKKASQFNIQEMDLQIQRKLQKKTKESRDKRISITAMHNMSINESNQMNKNININPHTNKMYSHTSNFDKINIPPSFDIKPKGKQNTNYALQSGGQTKRQKSPSLAFIDQKYQEYIHQKHAQKQKQKMKEEIQNLNLPPRSIRGHSKHVSNIQNFSIFNPSKIGKYPSHMNSNKNLYMASQMTSRNCKDVTSRLPTER